MSAAAKLREIADFIESEGFSPNLGSSVVTIFTDANRWAQTPGIDPHFVPVVGSWMKYAGPHNLILLCTKVAEPIAPAPPPMPVAEEAAVGR